MSHFGTGYGTARRDGSPHASATEYGTDRDYQSTAGYASTTTTHKITFPALRGVKAWGTYTKTSKGVKLYVCDEDTVRGVFASGGVALAYNGGWKLHTNLGAVAIGYHQTVCRTMTVHYTGHLMVYTATWTKTGRVGTRSANKVLY